MIVKKKLDNEKDVKNLETIEDRFVEMAVKCEILYTKDRNEGKEKESAKDIVNKIKSIGHQLSERLDKEFKDPEVRKVMTSFTQVAFLEIASSMEDLPSFDNKEDLLKIGIGTGLLAGFTQATTKASESEK